MELKKEEEKIQQDDNDDDEENILLLPTRKQNRRLMLLCGLHAIKQLRACLQWAISLTTFLITFLQDVLHPTEVKL